VIRVAVCDDHSVVRMGLREIISAQEDMQFAGEACCGLDAVALCEKTPPDILVLDIGLPDIDGHEVANRVFKAVPNTRVMIFTIQDNEDHAMRLLQAGAAAFVNKQEAADALLAAIRLVAGGGRYISPAIAEKMALSGLKNGARRSRGTLSKREMQIVVRLAGGLKPGEICQELGLKNSTVANHRARILSKLGLRNNADIARYAIKNNLLDNEKLEV
jgi:two-component system, NarL family, invasion response regulator UvrY